MEDQRQINQNTACRPQLGHQSQRDESAAGPNKGNHHMDGRVPSNYSPLNVLVPLMGQQCSHRFDFGAPLLGQQCAWCSHSGAPPWGQQYSCDFRLLCRVNLVVITPGSLTEILLKSTLGCLQVDTVADTVAGPELTPATPGAAGPAADEEEELEELAAPALGRPAADELATDWTAAGLLALGSGSSSMLSSTACSTSSSTGNKEILD